MPARFVIPASFKLGTLLRIGKLPQFAECPWVNAMDDYQDELLEQRAQAEEPSEPHDDAMEL